MKIYLYIFKNFIIFMIKKFYIYETYKILSQFTKILKILTKKIFKKFSYFFKYINYKY